MEASEIITELVNRSKDPYSKICKYEYCPNKEFTASRLNQEYCSYDCKKKANNLKAKQKRDSTKKINLILLKNRDILLGTVIVILVGIGWLWIKLNERKFKK